MGKELADLKRELANLKRENRKLEEAATSATQPAGEESEEEPVDLAELGKNLATMEKVLGKEDPLTKQLAQRLEDERRKKRENKPLRHQLADVERKLQGKKRALEAAKEKADGLRQQLADAEADAARLETETKETEEELRKLSQTALAAIPPKDGEQTAEVQVLLQSVGARVEAQQGQKRSQDVEARWGAVKQACLDLDISLRQPAAAEGEATAGAATAAKEEQEEQRKAEEARAAEEAQRAAAADQQDIMDYLGKNEFGKKMLEGDGGALQELLGSKFRRRERFEPYRK